MQWANFKSKGVLRSYPMVLDGGGLTADVPEDMELISITAASGVWMDDGSIINTVEDPDSKKARSDQKAQDVAARDVKSAKAHDVIAANPTLSIDRLFGLLKSLNLDRSRSWIGRTRAEILGGAINPRI